MEFNKSSTDYEEFADYEDQSLVKALVDFFGDDKQAILNWLNYSSPLYNDENTFK